MDKGTYDSLTLTGWLEKSGEPIKDHPEIPTEERRTKILGRQLRMAVEILLNWKLVKEKLEAKIYDLDEIEKGRAIVGRAQKNLLKKLADDRPVYTSENIDKPEVTTRKITKVGSCEDNQLEGRDERVKKCYGH